MSSSSLSEHQRLGSARSNANPLTGAVEIPDAVCVCVCVCSLCAVSLHFFFFFNLLITVVYFKAQTVKVDLGTLAEAGETLAGSSRAANARPEVMQGHRGKWGQLAGPPLSEGSPPPPGVVTEAITTEEASRKQPRSLTLKSRTSPAITSERRCACRRLEVQISAPQPRLTASILPSRGSPPPGQQAHTFPPPSSLVGSPQTAESSRHLR